MMLERLYFFFPAVCALSALSLACASSLVSFPALTAASIFLYVLRLSWADPDIGIKNAITRPKTARRFIESSFANYAKKRKGVGFHYWMDMIIA